MSRLPADSAFSDKLQRFVIELLYKDLPHPPAAYLALPPNQRAITPRAKVKYAYRTADGSDYNILFPSMGRAGMPYARSVPSLNTSPRYQLPDPGLVFDTLLRRDKFEPHPGGLSSLFFAFANLVIHTIFRTSHQDWTINDASSYLDLSILYGNSEKQVDSVRRKDGSGKLWDDVFADGRLLFMPPSVGALLIIFSRNHNVRFVPTSPGDLMFIHLSVDCSMSRIRFSTLMKPETSGTRLRKTMQLGLLKMMRYSIRLG